MSTWRLTKVETFSETKKMTKKQESVLFVANAFEGWEYDVKIHESNLYSQKHGIDVEIKKHDWKNYYSIEAIPNMNKFGTFYVETTPDGWLRSTTKTSDRVCHVCLETKWIAWYSRTEMIKWLRDNGHLREGLFEVTSRHKLPFISKRKIGQ